MPTENDRDGLSVIRRLTREYPTVLVVVVTALRKGGLLDAAPAAGAKGWLENSEGPAEFATAVTEVLAGNIHIDTNSRDFICQRVLERYHRHASPSDQHRGATIGFGGS